MARGGGRGGDGKARGGGGESGMGEKLKVRGEGRRARALRYTSSMGYTTDHPNAEGTTFHPWATVRLEDTL